MRRIPFEPDAPNPRILRQAGRLLAEGRVIAFPTETLYGLLARLDRPKALRRILDMKGRDAARPMPCLVADQAMAEKCFSPAPEDLKRLAKVFWPGPLTLVGRAHPDLVGHATGWGSTIGLRVPGLAALRHLSLGAGGAIAATSANRSGEVGALSPEEVAASFAGEEDLVLFDGGEVRRSRGSTILEASRRPTLLLRRGDLDPARIEEVLGRAPVELLLKTDERLQELMHGPLRIIQKLSGFRYSIDPILLAAFIDFDPGERIADIGSGSGVIPLILAGRGAKDVTGIEVQHELADMSRRSIAANGLEDRVRVVCGDARRPERLFPAGSFDVVVSNPPYFPVGTGLLSSDETRAQSRHELSLNLSELVDSLSYLLKDGGSFHLIHLAGRLPELLPSLARAGLFPTVIRPVLPTADTAAKLILLRGRKGDDEECVERAPLILHRKGGGYTKEVEEMMKGGNLCP